MDELVELIALRNRAAQEAIQANSEYVKAKYAITEWGTKQVCEELEKRGIVPGNSVVRMEIRRTRKGRIVIEPAEVLLENVGRVHPPTMQRGDLGPNASSTDMWWTAKIWWRNIRKDGTPGATHDFCVLSGDTAAEVAGKIERIRDLHPAPAGRTET